MGERESGRQKKHEKRSGVAWQETGREKERQTNRSSVYKGVGKRTGEIKRDDENWSG